jgi:hypothetical protein
VDEVVLEHYSIEPLIWPPRDYAQTYYEPGWGWPPKPTGLWVSVQGEDDWNWWCRAEDFRVEALAVCTRVILSPDANLKVVQGEAELIAFDREWGVDWSFGGKSDAIGIGAHRRIDWVKLAKEYDGIIIAPYVWSCRLPLDRNSERKRVSDWYYPWDCASGCIWNGTKAIAGFEEAPVRPSDQLTEGAASYDGNRAAET